MLSCPLASKPVMEGKGILFKRFAGIDVFDIEVNAPSVASFIETVVNISPTFGGINLEDIAAPHCFEIEEALKARLDIPWFSGFFRAQRIGMIEPSNRERF